MLAAFLRSCAGAQDSNAAYEQLIISCATDHYSFEQFFLIVR